MFEKCLITVSSEAEKQELLKGCKHIHDFTVWFQDKVKVTDEFGIAKEDCDVVRDMDEEDCGVCLNLYKYPFVNFLAGLSDCEDKSIRDEYIKVCDEEPMTQTWKNVRKAKEVIEKVKSQKEPV